MMLSVGHLRPRSPVAVQSPGYSKRHSPLRVGVVIKVVINAMVCDGADLIVRAVETRGAPARARIELPLVGRTIEGEFRPHEVRTFRVPLDPAGEIVEVDLLEWPLGEQPA